MNNPTYTPVYGAILDITPYTSEEGNYLVSLKTGEGPVHFIITEDTFIADQLELEIGTHVVMFYNSMLPIPLIYPPQYRAVFVSPWYADEFVHTDYFDENLLSAAGDLQLNYDSDTIITDAAGRPFNVNPANHVLMVYYTITTRSIPPLTTPLYIIVID